MEYGVAALLAVGGGWAAGHGAGLLVRAVRRADDPASSRRPCAASAASRSAWPRGRSRPADDATSGAR